MASNDILESWEDFTDFEAPKNGPMNKSKARPGDNENDDNDDEGGDGGVIVTEETHRTQYKPQIRILKREPQGTRSDANNADSISSHPNNGAAADGGHCETTKPKAKTLAQREAEYAEARRRILGPSYNPEEQQLQQPQLQQPPSTTSVPTPSLVPPFPPPPPSIADLVPPYPPPPIHPHLNHVHPPPPQAQPSTYDDVSPRRLAQRMENLKMNAGSPGVMVVRQPNGPDPDGFRGFSSFKSQEMHR